MKLIADRFLAKVSKQDDGCWLWTASTTLSGYGQFWIGDRRVDAHRASFELFNGEIPPGAFVLHSCDVKLCVNPAHLSAGTQAQNLADMVARGRCNRAPKVYGEAHPRAVLTDEKVREIRSRWPRETQTSLAAEYRVPQTSISSIVRRVTWKHVA
jgi:hypothetical protein